MLRKIELQSVLTLGTKHILDFKCYCHVYFWSPHEVVKQFNVKLLHFLQVFVFNPENQIPADTLRIQQFSRCWQDCFLLLCIAWVCDERQKNIKWWEIVIKTNTDRITTQQNIEFPNVSLSSTFHILCKQRRTLMHFTVEVFPIAGKKTNIVCNLSASTQHR